MVMSDHLNVIDNHNLKNVYGGLNVSGSLIKAFSAAINSALDIGRSLGTAIRRISRGRLCGF